MNTAIEIDPGKDWEEEAQLQRARIEAKRQEAEEIRRRAAAAFRKVAATAEGKEALEYLRTQICGAHLYPFFKDDRSQLFWCARRWVWGETEKLLKTEKGQNL